MTSENVLRITSTAFADNGDIPAKYTADGDNVNPPLLISGVSPQAKSLVLVIDDPDAATDPKGPGRTYDHWVVFNISPQITQIAENSVPAGAKQGKNGSGTNHYVGPAPPTGTHQYHFRLYELNDTLELDQDITKEGILAAVKPLLIAHTELIGRYQRP